MQGNKGLLLPDWKTELEAEELLLTGVTRSSSSSCLWVFGYAGQQGLLLPDGQTELEAEELLLTGVTRHHAVSNSS